MRGQRLFVRAVEPGDAPVIEAFLLAQGISGAVTACGLLGKIVGDLVAVLTCEIRGDAVHIVNLVVAPHLRRKRIGRFMVDEAARMARQSTQKQLVIENPGEAAGYFRKIGFEGNETRMVRRVE